jgi:hypothetical protein
MKTANNQHEESLHANKGGRKMPSMNSYINAKKEYRGFMATHSTNEDRGFNIYYDGMPGGQERTIEYAQALLKNGYDIEWSNNESTLKENQDEKLNTPKEKIQETAQQSRGTAGVTDKGEASRSPDTNSELKEREIEVEG